MLVAPIGDAELVLGFAIGGIFRGVFVGLMILGVGFVMADIHIENWWIVSGLLLLTSTAFALAGFLNALFSKTFDGVNIVPTFILTPLTFLGGVFYSLGVLPPLWQKVTLANPIFWIISGFREGFYGFSEISLWLPFGFLILITTILFAACVYFTKKGVNIRS
jgi:ABC-2 type transport system permease protein